MPVEGLTVPVKVGVVTLVRLSVLLGPASELADRSDLMKVLTVEKASKGITYIALEFIYPETVAVQSDPPSIYIPYISKGRAADHGHCYHTPILS